MSSDSPERGEEFFKGLHEVPDQVDLRQNAQELLRATRGIRLSDTFKPGDAIVLKTRHGVLIDEGLHLKLIASHGTNEIAPNQPVRARVVLSDVDAIPSRSFITIDAPELDGEVLDGDLGVIRADTPLRVTLLRLRDFHESATIDSASSMQIAMMYQRGEITDFGLGYSVTAEEIGQELLPGILSVWSFNAQGIPIAPQPWVSSADL